MSLTLMMPRVSLDTWRRMKPFKLKVTAPNMTAMKEFRAAESILPLSTAELESFVMLTAFFLYFDDHEGNNLENAVYKRSKGLRIARRKGYQVT